jgi:hypothetical protein
VEGGRNSTYKTRHTRKDTHTGRQADRQKQERGRRRRQTKKASPIHGRASWYHTVVYTASRASWFLPRVSSIARLVTEHVIVGAAGAVASNGQSACSSWTVVALIIHRPSSGMQHLVYSSNSIYHKS